MDSIGEGRFTSLIKIIEKNRISLKSVNLKNIIVNNFKNHNEVKGRVAEMRVLQWLYRCKKDGIQFEKDFPKTQNNILFTLTPTDILAFKGNECVCGYDFIIRYESTPYVVEVKSMRLNGFCREIKNALDTVSVFYGQPVNMVIFSPMHTLRKKEQRILSEFEDRVALVDSAYKLRDIESKVNDFYAINKYK